jgi:hypothetical protein
MDNWKTRAKAARSKLRGTRHGAKEAVLRDAAGGNDVNTVRREIFALNFLDALKDSFPDVRRQLEGVPLSIIELLARWNAFDEEAAIKAAAKVIDGRHNLESLSSAMKSARLKRKAGSGGESLEAAHRKKIEEPAWRALRDLLGEGLSNAVVQYKDSDDPPVDFRYLLKPEGRKSESVAALVVGPYQNRKLYHKRRHAWLWRAVALALEYDHVALLLPFQQEAEEYAEWITRKRRIADAQPLPAELVLAGGLSCASLLYRKVHVLRPDGFEKDLKPADDRAPRE